MHHDNLIKTTNIPTPSQQHISTAEQLKFMWLRLPLIIKDTRKQSTFLSNNVKPKYIIIMQMRHSYSRKYELQVGVVVAQPVIPKSFARSLDPPFED